VANPAYPVATPMPPREGGPRCYQSAHRVLVHQIIHNTHVLRWHLKYFCSYIFYAQHSCRIYLVGQSAGAHIATCALLNQAIRESGEGDTSSWSVSQIKAYFGISGG
jgi:hypothetical protein